MEQNNKPKDLGAAWIKSGSYGDYISVSVEINGVKHNFTMFPNKYKKEGSKQPDYRIPAPKQPQAPSKQVDKYQTQLDNVMAQKAAKAQIKAKDNNSSFNQEASFTELDIPF